MNRYKLLLILLGIPVIIHTAWRAVKHKDLKYFKQRLGLRFNVGNKRQSAPIWIHAASVGEVNAAASLIHEISKNNEIILTTNTQSSAARAEKILHAEATHYYCPVDWQWAVKKFILQFQPQLLIIIETELWPNLFSVCHSRNIPVTIINGRISKRTLNATSWIKKRYRECLQSTQMILTRSTEDSQRFIELGAAPAIVKTIGNIKFYQQQSSKDVTAFKTAKPYVLAASTRDEEELLIVTAWQAAQKTHGSSNLLVIVPRHPHRLNTIIAQLEALNLNTAIRSRNEAITDDTELYIADTFGELVSFIKGAKFVIMGGSFVNKGGQNILEVAQANKTVVFGPYMANFKDEAQLFVKHKAGIQIEDVDTLAETIQTLLTQPERLEELENNATQLVQQQQGILDTYLSELQKNHPNIKIIKA